jgi:hypothetical protein
LDERGCEGNASDPAARRKRHRTGKAEAGMGNREPYLSYHSGGQLIQLNVKLVCSDTDDLVVKPFSGGPSNPRLCAAEGEGELAVEAGT